MAENIFSSFRISSEGLAVQRMRLSSIAKNIANANTTKGTNGEPYKREIVVARSVAPNSFGNELASQLTSFGASKNPARVIEASVEYDDSEPRMIHDPSHPDADDKGYIQVPNINVVNEMVEMISAQRAFEANVNVIESAKNIARDSLDI